MRFHFVFIALLLSLGAACDLDDSSAAREHRLLRAARNGYTGDIKKLLDQGVDIEARNPSDGWSPVFWAAVRDNAPAVKLLASRGANIEARDRKGLTALMCAARWGHSEGVVALLDAGANIEAVDGNGWSALMWAAFKGQSEMAAFLLDRGAVLETRDIDGRTPLILAAMKGHEKTVTLLLARGAAIGARGPGGKTAADLAEMNGYADLAKRIRASSGR
jgi:serine/threonine-protein phosphatase 6 regulatory ankyrin repeat subunit B